MAPYDELPVRVRRVIDRCRGGERLCRSYRLKATGDHETLYHYEPSGNSAPEKSSIAAISSGLLRPCGDGLFGGDTSQSWEVTE